MKGIIGAICGDIIGSTREFHPIKTKEFELIPKYSRFTDDTVLTIAIASWILKDEQLRHGTLINEIRHICNSYPRLGYGGRFNHWLNSNNPGAYNSGGNGSAMRVSPVGWIADNLEQTQLIAKRAAEVTHNAREGIKGAVTTASCIYLARTGRSKEFIKEYIEDIFHYDLSRSLDEIRPNYSFEVSCQKSVPESIICFLEADNYEDAVRNAISLGGDADTQAAIAGSIAAAYYDVPEEIYKECLEILDLPLFEIFNEFNRRFYK